MSSIVFQSVCKRYDDVVAVADLDLSCDGGDMLALLGPSGCGKSTILKMAAGIEAVSSGEIYFGERPVSRLAPGERDIAMVFEDYALYPQMSVRKNIAFPLKVRGVPAGTALARVNEVLELLGLSDLADQGVREMSGGAQQRIAIGRALVRDPEVILFDEPLSHLDADQKVQLRTEIKRLQKLRHVTSILVTHDQTEAIAMADRIAVMNHGVLQQVGTPQDLYERPANLFVANFIGEPPMNLLPVRIGEEGRLLGRGWSMVPEACRASLTRGHDGDMVAGVRPEHIHVHPAEASGGFPGRIRYREPRGDADVLTIELDGTQGGGDIFVVEIAGPSQWRAGDRVAITMPAASLLVFDAASGRNLEATA